MLQGRGAGTGVGGDGGMEGWKDGSHPVDAVFPVKVDNSLAAFQLCDRIMKCKTSINIKTN